MRITRRTSGGRGEYEISETTPGGASPNDLIGRSLILEFPNGWRVDAGVRLTTQGGKRRLRLTTSDMQVQRQMSAALLLPEPIRADEAFGVGEPVVQRGRYAIEHINIEEVRLVGADEAILHVGRLIVRNGSVAAEELNVARRLEHLSSVWAREAEFPPEIARLIRDHRAALQSGAPLSSAVADLVERLQFEMSQRSTDMGIVYSQQTDVMDALQESLEIEAREPVVQPAEVDPEEPELRLRTAKEWKRWANARGPKSARFRSEVRDAYRATCLMCGDRFPPTSFSLPGVDAAHILPWSQYDLDEVHNGLCLCKLHHWAFDEALLVLHHESGKYVTELPTDVEDRLISADPEFSAATLRRAAGVIPAERLPSHHAHWPRPEFLDRLNEVVLG